ncbi:hypothetical protein HZC00_03785 [Candidatus Kaiserbacteria bacterium]|nr:hypothetical protein [Candidatus Kaiserbacteria bacterium]
MNNPHEHMHHTERFRSDESPQDAPPAGLTLPQAQSVYTERSEMLASIHADISRTLFDALRTKIEYEREFLLSVVESEAKIAAMKKRLNKTLKSEYFVQKPLDTHI